MKFKLTLADWDTVLFRAAKFVQEDYIIATHKASGHKKEFKNKTEFYGHWKSKSGGWLAQRNKARVERDLEPFAPEDFAIEECARLNPEIDDHLGEAEKTFDFAVGALKKAVDSEDYRLAIGGEGNFRYAIAKQLPYKGHRKDKPLLFTEFRDFIIRKYKSKIIIVDGMEADDYCSKVGWENYHNFLKTGEWDICLAYIDKDLDMIISPSFNYDDSPPEVRIPTPFDAAMCYAVQLLAGDKGTDNIPGLPNFSEKTKEKYSLGNTKGIGVATAQKYLRDCETIKEAFERVVEAYKSYWGTKATKFIDHTGEVHEKWNWKDYLQDNARLLWMYRDDTCEYDIFEDTLKPLKVKYGR
jgi:hypothetical protein